MGRNFSVTVADGIIQECFSGTPSADDVKTASGLALGLHKKQGLDKMCIDLTALDEPNLGVAAEARGIQELFGIRDMGKVAFCTKETRIVGLADFAAKAAGLKDFRVFDTKAAGLAWLKG